MVEISNLRCAVKVLKTAIYSPRPRSTISLQPHEQFLGWHFSSALTLRRTASRLRLHVSMISSWLSIFLFARTFVQFPSNSCGWQAAALSGKLNGAKIVKNADKRRKRIITSSPRMCFVINFCKPVHINARVNLCC